MQYLILISFAALILSGCADMQVAGIEVPNPKHVIEKPLGTESVKLGMSKDQVKHIWGDPDNTEMIEDKTTGRAREVWTYKARYSGLPVDAGYLSKTKKCYFDGDNLAGISE